MYRQVSYLPKVERDFSVFFSDMKESKTIDNMEYYKKNSQTNQKAFGKMAVGTKVFVIFQDLFLAVLIIVDGRSD